MPVFEKMWLTILGINSRALLFFPMPSPILFLMTHLITVPVDDPLLGL